MTRQPHRGSDIVVALCLTGAGAGTLLGLNPPPWWHYATVGQLVTWEPPPSTDSSGDEHRTPPAPPPPEFSCCWPIRFTIGWFIVSWSEVGENAGGEADGDAG